MVKTSSCEANGDAVSRMGSGTLREHRLGVLSQKTVISYFFGGLRDVRCRKAGEVGLVFGVLKFDELGRE